MHTSTNRKYITHSFLLLALISAVACGGSSPTEPTTPVAAASKGTPAPPPPSDGENVPPPSPTPAPTPPAPPAPPTPEPPAPEPPTLRWTGTITSAHWIDAAALPDTFDVELKGEVVKFGTLPQLPVITRTSTAFIAGRPGTILEAHLEAAGWVWSYRGIEGEATGTMKEKEK